MIAEENLKRLSALAKAATPEGSPVHHGLHGRTITWDRLNQVSVSGVATGNRLSKIAEYISATQPQALLTLIEVIRLQNEALRMIQSGVGVPRGSTVEDCPELAEAALEEVDRRLGELK